MFERLHDQAQNGAGRGGVGQVGLNGRGLQLQLAAGRVQVIAFLGDREADDAGAGRAHAGQHLAQVGRATQQFDDRADHLQLFGTGRPLHQRVKPVLRRQCVFGAGGHQAGTHNAPSQVTRGQHRVGHHRLVGAVKSTHAQMNDGADHLAAVIVRAVAPWPAVGSDVWLQSCMGAPWSQSVTPGMAK